MYVIRLCVGELSRFYFVSLENGRVHYSSDIKKAMLFPYRSEAFIMSGLLENLCLGFDFCPNVYPVSTDDEYFLDDAVWFNAEAVCDDVMEVLA